MTIAAILKAKGRDVVSLAPDATVADAVALLADRRIGAVPVTGGADTGGPSDGGPVRGILSERDVIHALATKGAAALGLMVADVMTAPARTVEPDQTVLGALSLMTRRRIRHLPVLDDGRMVGFVSIGDLVKYRIDRIQEEADALRTYIQAS